MAEIVEEEGDERSKLLHQKENTSSSDPESQLTSSSSPRIRTGTIWTAMAHLITGVMGAGVLSLGWSLAQLGWLYGIIAIVSFAVVTGGSTYFFSDCYKSTDSNGGLQRHPSFLEAVQSYLGDTCKWICAVLYTGISAGNDIGYTIAAATSFGAILRWNCHPEQGHDAACKYQYIIILLFGVLQIFMSHIPNFNAMSVGAAIISFVYSFICVGLGVQKVIDNGNRTMGSIGGVQSADKVWRVFQGLGVIAFAYPYSMVLLEIQDTLSSPPAETVTMRKASNWAIVITTSFYLLAGGFGYAAFGDKMPPNLLTGFGSDEPCWLLIDFANFCVVLHLIGGYQVFSQPFFAFVEGWLAERYPQSQFVSRVYPVNPPFLPAFQVMPLRLCVRSLYVVTTTVIAMWLLPYFNQVLGILGALSFWPLSICFPLQMYLEKHNIARWTRKWVAFQTVSFVCFIASALALIGSSQGLISAMLK